ncbi:MAG: glucosyltransferase domain-containing protein [Ruminococcus sp.]|nr:glucosyltransferase domain-containing protein [Ruminococcus sp.]
MINSIKTFYNDIARKKAFWLPVLLFTLLAYGFSLTRNTLSIDDMSLDFYGGIRGAIVASGRWGMEVWHKLLGINGYSPYIYKFFGVLFLLAAAFLMCCIFYNLKPSYSSKVYPYTFFASIIITFPLINEIWEYNGANAVVGANLFVVFLSILYILFSEQKLWIKFLISGLMMSVVVSSYESALFVYITAVMCVLFYRYCVLREK